MANKKTTVTLRSRSGKKGYSLYLDIYHRGKRSNEYLNLTVSRDYTSPKGYRKPTLEDEAQLREAKFIAKERLEKLLKEPLPQPAAADLLAYMKTIAVTRKNGNALYQAAAASLRRFQGEKPLSMRDLSLQWIDNYVAFLKRDKLSINTVLHYVNAINLTMKEAVRDGLVSANIFDRYDLKSLRKQREETVIEFLSIEDLQTLAQVEYTSNPEISDAFLFCCFTGLRVSDIKNLTWGDVRGDQLHFAQIKTGGASYLPMNETALSILEKYQRGENAEKVFPTLPTRPGISYALNKWAKDAGLTVHMNFHMARHTYGTLLAASGTDANTLRTLLGHKSTNSSQIYVHIANKSRQEAVAKLPNIKSITAGRGGKK